MFLLDERVEANRLDKVGAQKRDFRVTHSSVAAWRLLGAMK